MSTEVATAHISCMFYSSSIFFFFTSFVWVWVYFHPSLHWPLHLTPPTQQSLSALSFSQSDSSSLPQVRLRSGFRPLEAELRATDGRARERDLSITPQASLAHWHGAQAVTELLPQRWLLATPRCRGSGRGVGWVKQAVKEVRKKKEKNLQRATVSHSVTTRGDIGPTKKKQKKICKDF